MLFSQTSGRTHKDRPVFSAEPSQGERDKTVPASAQGAPDHFGPKANGAQLQSRARPGYSPAAQETEQPSGSSDD